MQKQTRTLLKEIFGYDQFRPLQEDIIHKVLAKKDTLVVMPTGGGKSLCYQLPALLFQGLTVVISPLIALMKDQVEQLVESGVDAILLNSTLSREAYQENIRRIRYKETRLLYVAPETLLKPDILALLSSIDVDCITIDEAHCISEWGHDFRPEYRKITHIRKRFPGAVCIALTATATPRVREDIRQNLQFQEDARFIASFNRENLFIEVTPKENPLQQTTAFLKKFPGQSGIIYCFSRRQVEELSEYLQRQAFSARPYHAGLSDIERKENQEGFIRDDIQIIVATIAFGMGINKPNVRFILHYDLPKSIESYYQEIGRAGRDGLAAHCLLLFSYGDIRKIKFFIDQKENEQQWRIANAHLDKIIDYSETNECRRLPLLNYFGEERRIKDCGNCDNCTAEKKELVDITIPAQKFLSCIYRTGQYFGSNHIIDVLRGSGSEKIIVRNHQKLSTYGIGKEFSKKQWLHLSRQFLRLKLLVKDAAYGSLKLTQKGVAVLSDKEKVFGTIQEAARKPERTKSTSVSPDSDQTLFELLRNKRKELADQVGVPPYIIFSDRTLLEMSANYPASREALLELHGVGLVKFEKYGQIFLELIHLYCRRQGISPSTKGVPAAQALPTNSTSNTSGKKSRYILIGEAFNAGKSIEALMAEFTIQRHTVIDNLNKFFEAGFSLDADPLLSESSCSQALRTTIFQLFETLGSQHLKPLYNALNRKIGYDELKILRLIYLSKLSL